MNNSQNILYLLTPKAFSTALKIDFNPETLQLKFRTNRRSLKKIKQITFMWVFVYAGIKENEIAHQQAKNTTNTKVNLR